MLTPFQKKHLLQILVAYDEGTLPIDVHLKKYLRANRSIGATDRRVISKKLYYLVRMRGLLDHYLEKPYSWEKRLSIEPKPTDDLPLHVRVSYPRWLFEKFSKHYGEQTASKLCSISNQEAPITIRVNTLKTTPQEFFAKWSETYPMRRCASTETAISFHKRENFLVMPPFKQGLFEVQDENSQRISNLLEADSSSLVLDYCAGSGGKSLAIAGNMEGKGQIYLHDIRPYPLKEAKKRLARAGAGNAQTIETAQLKKKKYQQFFTHLLLDVPCSGTGTLRRNPDLKWRLSPSDIEDLIKTQREIFEKSLRFVKSGGKILYATCSILPEENKDQVDHFLKTYPVKLKESVQFFPEESKGDGFYGALFSYHP